MQLSDYFGLLGGLALFLYGMQMMSAGLEAAAGAKMQRILERLTANRLLGVLVGAGITAVIQSSSATTVMVVGFVNAGMMSLYQAVWIIMGANIGTTVTGQLLVLDVGLLAPVLSFVGVVLAVFVKKPQVNHVGQILAGLGILFLGMGMMSGAMAPLRHSPAFAQLMGRFTNPLLGILAGAGVTAIIQSSSASVGILQALADSGVVKLSNAVYVLFGQNIGTCITAILAAMGTSRNAKRTTLIHLLFNIIGTVVFTFLCMTLPLVALVEALTPLSTKAQIANMHTLFNVVTTLLLLPLGKRLADFTIRLLPDRPQDRQREQYLEFLTPVQINHRDGGFGTSALNLGQLRQELNRMLRMARENVETAFRAAAEGDAQAMPEVERREDYIDFLNKEISRHIARLITYETNDQAATAVSCYFTITGNIERIGDHAMNICGYTRVLAAREIRFSPAALAELEEMRRLCLDGIDALLGEEHENEAWLEAVSALEQRSDDMTELFRRTHLERMRRGDCSDEACIIFSELLTDFERLGDHILNIAQELAQIT